MDAEYEFCTYAQELGRQLDTLNKDTSNPAAESADKERRCSTSHPPFGPYEPMHGRGCRILSHAKNGTEGSAGGVWV